MDMKGEVVVNDQVVIGMIQEGEDRTAAVERSEFVTTRIGKVR